MDPSAPQTVFKGTAITSLLCGLTAGIYGGLKHSTPAKFFIYSAVNSGIVAATFFSLREYVVSPALVSTVPGRQYQLRRQKSLHAVGSPTLEESTALSWADIRTSHLLDSGISGGLAGGILNTLKRGRQGLVPGLATGALMCTLLQWSFNEFNIVRIRYVSAETTTRAQHMTQDTPSASQTSPTEPSTPTTIQPASFGSAATPSIIDRMLSVFGQRVSDEKYLERLKTERDSYLRRIAELEKKE